MLSWKKIIFIDYFVNNFDKEISFTYDLESLESNKSWNETTTVYPSSFLYTFEDTGLKVVNLNYNEIYFSGMRTMKFDFTNILIRSNNLIFQNCQSFWNKEGKIYVKSAGWGKSDLETSLLNTFFEKIEPEEIKEEPVLNNNEIEVEDFNDVIAKMKAPEIDEYYEIISNNHLINGKLSSHYHLLIILIYLMI